MITHFGRRCSGSKGDGTMNVFKRVHLTNFRRGVRTSVFEEEGVCVCARAHMFCGEDMKIFEG